MKNAVQKTKKPTFLRYEFSDEKGRLEGGDIFEFTSIAQLQKLMSAVIDVADGDGVSISLTIGKEETFFNFLKNQGLTQKEISAEMTDISELPSMKEKKAKKPAAKKVAKKTRTSKKA